MERLMDIRCNKCGEPWDLDELHYVDGKSFDEARKAFYRVGCEVFESRHGETPWGDQDLVLALQELAGDDIDGLASDLDDAAWLGIL